MRGLVRISTGRVPDHSVNRGVPLLLIPTRRLAVLLFWSGRAQTGSAPKRGVIVASGSECPRSVGMLWFWQMARFRQIAQSG